MKKPRRFCIAAKRSHYLEWVTALLILAPLVIFMAGSYHWEMGHAVLIVSVIAFMVVFAALSLWARQRYAATGRLIVDDLGMRLESELPRFLAAPYQGPWKVQWSEIDKVIPVDAVGLLQIRRKGFTAMPLAIKVLDWVPEDGTRAAAPRSGRRAPKMRETELWRVLEEHGLFGGKRRNTRAEALNFDLAKHPVTRALLAVMAVLVAYWAVDSIMAEEAWAEWRAAYVLPHVAIGIAGAVLGFVFMKIAAGPMAIPGQIAAVLAMFLGFSIGLASWTGIVRLNQLVGGPLSSEEYVRNETCDSLMPIKTELPPIEYTELAKGYWCQFPKDHKHLVLIRRGLGGLYQVDLTQHTEAIREFRRSGKAPKRS